MYHVFFILSMGLAETLNVKAGHHQAILNHVATVEQRLGLARKDEVARWMPTDFTDIDDEVLCYEAQKHNEWVREVYHYWGSKPEGPELLTPEMAAEFWHALSFIRVPPRRWTEDYYEDQMTRVFDVMVKGEQDGVYFDADPISPRQAGQVIYLFSEFLDTHRLDLVVPHDYDYLTRSEELQWCSMHERHLYSDDGCAEHPTCKETECYFVECVECGIDDEELNEDHLCETCVRELANDGPDGWNGSDEALQGGR